MTLPHGAVKAAGRAQSESTEFDPFNVQGFQRSKNKRILFNFIILVIFRRRRPTFLLAPMS